ncbi:Histone-lysine N-methyltransferase [Nymphaea thermarum]|nr:Histone-lysine N-methyltransferase [Nymphaea thermarum]
MDDQGAADVYRPLQFDQPEDGSMVPAAPVAENAALGSNLVPCDGGELQELIPSPSHHVVGGTLVDGVLDVEMAVVTAQDRGGARESSSGRGRSGGVKRKRGRKGGRTPVKTKKSEEEEDVCFICFDGGNLVLCDRKMCPKAYHPTCVNRDEAFFRKKGRWNCGWHLCSVCEKAAHFLCYTCTYSLCKGCIRQSDFLCVRANKGLCVNCMRLVMLIENKDANKENSDLVGVT